MASELGARTRSRPLPALAFKLTGKCRHHIIAQGVPGNLLPPIGPNALMARPLLVRTTPERSALMKRVRQRGTDPELMARRILSDIGAHYRLNVKSLPGSPDVVNRRLQKAIFVHGCFWHGHARCGRGTIPMTNRRFWLDKLHQNTQRDRRKIAALRS